MDDTQPADANMASPDRLSEHLDNCPRLPAEIEREIFIFAFHDNIEDRCNLLLVATRVAEWLLPFLYHTIIIEWSSDDNHNGPPISSFEKYGHYVRHLFVQSFTGSFPIDWSSALLRFGPNVWDLGFWFEVELTPHVFDLPIKRLILDNIKFLKARLDSNLDDVLFVQWRSNITHLGVGEPLEESEIQYLVHFPALEYLMILEGDGFGDTAAILHRCPQLKVVIQTFGVVSDSEITQIMKEEEDGDAQDIRIVTVDALIGEDWRRGTEGQPDIWELAEREVEMRRCRRRVSK